MGGAQRRCIRDADAKETLIKSQSPIWYVFSCNASS